MLIDIVILPPKSLRKKIGIKMKKEIGHLSNFFVVDNNKLIPHLSLWHINTSQKGVNEIARELKQIAEGQKPIKIIPLEFKATEKYTGCLEFPVKINKDLTTFREKVFQRIYPYKTGTMPQFGSFLGIKYSKEKLREIKKYGRAIGFHPHFTMGWFKNEKNIEDIVKKMKGVKFSFTSKEVYICEVNNWWQVKRIIKKIDF
ncbi:MAG: hypothetical protein V4699_00775 [Patescibacteria group bacterium]